jgi:pimeloyl-ACP methyl ester carboxylesterase
MPAARTVVVPGAGHAVHLERPDLWLEVVGGFLGR